ncbi:hypothetical protein K4K59_013249 [Colletotrichum sp. SAR11_240]|nr:hypothetical protein K4K59_013249 [Colletotrichum sp. SAR11_240]
MARKLLFYPMNPYFTLYAFMLAHMDVETYLLLSEMTQGLLNETWHNEPFSEFISLLSSLMGLASKMFSAQSGFSQRAECQASLSADSLTTARPGFMSGYYFCGAFVFMPAVQKAPSPLVAQQWKRAWDVGRYVGKIVVTGTAASFAYLAYAEPVKTGNYRFQLFAAAASIVGAIVPYTMFVSYPFNEAINGQLGATGGDKTELKNLVADWGRTDWKRSLLAFFGTFIGVCGALA